MYKTIGTINTHTTENLCNNNNVIATRHADGIMSHRTVSMADECVTRTDTLLYALQHILLPVKVIANKERL
jgi:hypothetical protein